MSEWTGKWALVRVPHSTGPQYQLRVWKDDEVISITFTRDELKEVGDVIGKELNEETTEMPEVSQSAQHSS